MKESWLEIYKVPKDTWVKEVETAVATVGARSRKPTMVESTPPVSSFLVQSALLGWLWELPVAKELRRYGAMALWR